MSVMIRLTRPGKSSKKRLHWRVVACDKREGRDSLFLEELGYYDPRKNPILISLKKERIAHWVKNGAKLSDTVRSLLKKVK
ncbi:MAG: 30S ribosomal protein S16 [Candidatus Omnitrophota bacterium]